MDIIDTSIFTQMANQRSLWPQYLHLASDRSAIDPHNSWLDSSCSHTTFLSIFFQEKRAFRVQFPTNLILVQEHLGYNVSISVLYILVHILQSNFAYKIKINLLNFFYSKSLNSITTYFVCKFSGLLIWHFLSKTFEFHVKLVHVQTKDNI